MNKMTKFAIIKRDFKGNYENVDHVKGMFLHGGERECYTYSDSFALCFVDGNTDKTPQELYDINERLYDQEVDGYELQKNIVVVK